MDQSIHILTETGVLTSFSIAKQVSDEDIKDFFEKQKKSGKTNKEIRQMLRDKIMSDIQLAVKDNNIPGLIAGDKLNTQLSMENGIDHIPELNKLIMLITNKMSETQYNKMSLCYFINGLVSLLRLSEEDFDKFHSRNDGEEDDDDSDEYEDGDGEV